jgi:peptide alpha-N-acetyltransferase
MKGNECIGCIVCRLTVDKSGSRRGYIAMLAVSPAYRGAGLGTTLVQLALDAMRAQGAALCVLEAEVTTNVPLQ